jgi:hypothetical protein
VAIASIAFDAEFWGFGWALVTQAKPQLRERLQSNSNKNNIKGDLLELLLGDSPDFCFGVR